MTTPLGGGGGTYSTSTKVAGGVIALLIVLLLAGMLSNLGSSSSSKTEPPTTTYSYTPKPHIVRYLVKGSAVSADITYQTPSGVSQNQGVDVPLSTEDGKVGLTVRGFGAGDFVYISAQNSGESGDLTCSIEVDGTVVSENVASGAYAIASCQGQA